MSTRKIINTMVEGKLGYLAVSTSSIPQSVSIPTPGKS